MGDEMNNEVKTRLLKAIHVLSGNSENENNYVNMHLSDPNRQVELFTKHVFLDEEHKKFNTQLVKVHSYFLLVDDIVQFFLYIGNVLIREELYELDRLTIQLENIVHSKSNIIYELGGTTQTDKEKYYQIYSLFLPPNIFGVKLNNVTENEIKDIILNSPMDSGRYYLHVPGNRLALYDFTKKYSEIDVQSIEADTGQELGYLKAGGGNLYSEPKDFHKVSMYLKEQFKELFKTFHKPTVEALISITTADEDPQHLEKGYNYYMQKEDETLISKAILEKTVFCTDTK